MADTYLYIALISYFLSGALLVVTIIMFFRLRIYSSWKDLKGSMEQKQIEEIRLKNADTAKRNVAADIFERMEENAKVQRTDNLGDARNTYENNKVIEFSPMQDVSSGGTVLLNQTVNPFNKDFVIEKNIMFVCTNEVL